jgi:hypothetical protein
MLFDTTEHACLELKHGMTRLVAFAVIVTYTVIQKDLESPNDGSNLAVKPHGQLKVNCQVVGSSWTCLPGYLLLLCQRAPHSCSKLMTPDNYSWLQIPGSVRNHATAAKCATNHTSHVTMQ